MGSYFSMTTTTSPNSLLLASLDATRAQFQGIGDEENISDGRKMIREAVRAANTIRELVRSHYKTTTTGAAAILRMIFHSSISFHCCILTYM